ncbi:MAG: ADP-glyceromanno-heptose 6-epimerase [Chlorobium limicola]|uniref:ADP-L-glycero-D-manno-heptose-6-epimerase n=1 Tax=Chlorobium limicola (strain DSM 245 / NBRC 103803 / 6330) TaxID=290315 RepID=B3ECG0_CHLL2|nr:ADP-glyceromanno-heptose 6-epimerase [Chlorobium limicola]ACD90235.1 ADP-L-glycero-D-manno-heptose-6-epimerase [Chlorobium limicola DSM 245]NTV19941.1 ADP-glyceromanno-heptose 6-epimerase [Chlorobium limicola]
MIIITGGAGFIGSALLWELNMQGRQDIVVVDTLGSTATGQWRNLSGLSFADFIPRDNFLPLLESGAFTGITAVIHMGAISATTETDADLLIERNFAYSKSIAAYCMKKNIRLIYASSAATYGDGTAGYEDDETRIDSLRPLNMYGYSKQLFDRWALKQGILEHAAGLKFFNVYGPNEYHKSDMTSVVYKAFNQIRENGQVSLFKSHRPDYHDGEQMRDFVYIRDCTAIMIWLLDHPDISGIFNIGSGEARSFNDLVNATFAALNLKPAINYVPMPEHLQGRYQYHTRAEMAKLRTAGFHKPMTPLEEGVGDYVRNYLDAETPYYDLQSIHKKINHKDF